MTDRKKKKKIGFAIVVYSWKVWKNHRDKCGMWKLDFGFKN